MFEDTGDGIDDKVMAIRYEDQNLTVFALNDAGNAITQDDIVVVNRDGNVGFGGVPGILAKFTVLQGSQDRISVDVNGAIRLSSAVGESINILGGESSDVTVRAGNAAGDVPGILTLGNSVGGTTGSGGRVDILGGPAFITTSNPGGPVNVIGGTGGALDGTGGVVTVAGGVGGLTNGDGGLLIVRGGFGTGAGVDGELRLSTLGATTRVLGDLVVEGTTTTVDSETVLIADNHLYLNAGYTTAAAQTGGLVVNILPAAPGEIVNGSYVAGISATSNPTVTTVGTTLSVGQFIQISNSNDNDGLYEVLSHVANLLTIRGVGTTGTVEDFTQNQFVAGVSDGAAITRVTISAMRASTTGPWEQASGITTGLTFFNTVAGGSDIQLQINDNGVLAGTPSLTLTPGGTFQNTAASTAIFGGDNANKFFIRDNASVDVLFVNTVTNRIGVGDTGGSANINEKLHVNVSGTSGYTSPVAERGILITDSAGPRLVFEDAGETADDKIMLWEYTGQNLIAFALNDAGSAVTQDNILVLNRDGQVSLGTATPDASSILDITSTTLGFLMPRMTTTQRDAVSSPATGLEIFNTTTNEPNFFNGTVWGSTSGSETLAQTLTNGNVTGGTDISITSGDSIITPAGSGAGAGGALPLVAGQGGTTGVGGAVSITAGTGGSTSGDGGAVDITSGAASSTSGVLTIATGNVTDDFGTPGLLSIIGGSSTGADGQGGFLQFTGGTGTTAGGGVNITGGASTVSGAGADVVFTGGQGAAGGAGGQAIVQGGVPGTNADGGGVIVRSSAGNGTGGPGAVDIQVAGVPRITAFGAGAIALTSGPGELINILGDSGVKIGAGTLVSPLHFFYDSTADNATTGFTIEQTNISGNVMLHLVDRFARYVIGTDNSDDNELRVSPGPFINASVGMNMDRTTGNVAIGNSTSSPAAVLTLGSQTKGFLPPRMTTAQMNGISGASAGMIVYDNTTNELNVRGTSAFAPLGDFFGPSVAVSGNLVSFGDTTGKLGADSGIVASTLSGGPFLPLAGGEMSGPINMGTQAITNAGPITVEGGSSDVRIKINTTGANPALVLTSIGQQDWSLGIDQSDSGKLKIGASTAVGSNTRLTIESGGNVGINETAPQNLLHVTSGDTGLTADPNSPIILESTLTNTFFTFLGTNTNNMGLLFGNAVNNADGGIIYLNPTRTMQFRTGGNTTRMTIDSTGDVGIGITAPRNRLHVLTGGTSTYTGANRGIIITDDLGPRIAFEHTAQGVDQKLMIQRWESGVFSFDTLNDAGSVFLTQNILSLSQAGTVGVGAAPDSSQLRVTNPTQADGDILLRLDTDRSWSFRQAGVGASTQLELRSDNESKNFLITNSVGTPVATFFASTALQPTVTIDGHLETQQGRIKSMRGFNSNTTTGAVNFVEVYNLVGIVSDVTLTISSADIALGSTTEALTFIVKDTSGAIVSSGFTFTIATEGSETIDGQTSIQITADYGVVRLFSDGSNLFSF